MSYHKRPIIEATDHENRYEMRILVVQFAF